MFPEIRYWSNLPLLVWWWMLGDIEMLAGAMEHLLRDESMRTRLAENARLTFESRFSLDTLSKKMILLYEGLGDRNERLGTA